MSKYNMGEWKKRGVTLNILAREEQYRIMDSLGLVHPDHFHANSADSLEMSMKSLRRKESCFLVLAQPRKTIHQRQACFDVKSSEDFERFYDKISGSDYDFDFIEQVSGTPSSFVATATSDGLGEIVIECLKEPSITNVHLLTSGICDPNGLSYFYFTEFSEPRNVSVSDRFPEPAQVMNIRSKVEGIRGYFEVVFGFAKSSGLNYYFTEFENSAVYMRSIEIAREILPYGTNKLGALLFKNSI